MKEKKPNALQKQEKPESEMLPMINDPMAKDLENFLRILHQDPDPSKIKINGNADNAKPNVIGMCF